MSRIAALGLVAGLAGCATQRLPAAPEMAKPAYALSGDVLAQDSRGALESAVAAYTQAKATVDTVEYAASARRGPGYRAEGLSLKAPPGKIAPVGVWARAYQDGPIDGELNQGGRLYLDIPVGETSLGKALLQVDGRMERGSAERLTDGALGVKVGDVLVKAGETRVGGERFPRLFAVYDTKGEERRWVLAGGWMDDAASIYKLFAGSEPARCSRSSTTDGYRVVLSGTPRGDFSASALYIFDQTEPSILGLAAFGDRDNSLFERFGATQDVTEYRVKPLVEQDRRTWTAHLNGSLAESAGARSWSLGGIAYPAGVTGADLGALNGFYVGAGARGTDTPSRETVLKGEVGFRYGPWILNLEKEESGPAQLVFQVQMEF